MKVTLSKKPGRPPDDALRESRCEQILKVAAELFARHGYAGTDTQLLADKLGVGKGTIYRYFPSKEELFLAAADRVMRHMKLMVDAAIQHIPEPLDQIAEAITTYLAFFAEHPDYVELLMQERAQFRDRKESTYFQYVKNSVERWWDIYRQLIARGQIRDMPVERITDVLGQLCYGTMFTNYFKGQRKPFAEQARDILDVVFHGILSDTERQKRMQRAST
jgi:AcrR family transcriptional regulator